MLLSMGVYNIKNNRVYYDMDVSWQEVRVSWVYGDKKKNL